MRHDLAHGLHRVEQTNVRVIAEHVIEGALAVNQLQLVEFHILRSLLELALLLEDLLL